MLIRWPQWLLSMYCTTLNLCHFIGLFLVKLLTQLYDDDLLIIEEGPDCPVIAIMN